MTKENIPMKAGLYFAISGEYAWYNLIVEVYGEPPFLKIDAWDRLHGRIIENFDPNDISVWGKEIPDPNKN